MSGHASVATQEPGTDHDNEREKGKSDDKCIGNRKVRTVILCLLLLAFSVFAAGYLWLLVESAKAGEDVTDGCPKCVEGAKSRIHGANCIFAALILIMLFTLITMILVCIPSCDPNKTKGGRLPGIILIFSGGLYLFGWFLYISSDKEIGYSFLTDEQQQDQDAEYLALFGEALLYGATIILMGLDLLIPSRFLMEDEFKRLFCNLGILCAQAVLTMPAYFLLSGSADGVEAIGSGYIVICISTATYIFIYLTSCCCDCKDKTAVRVVLALFLFIGGVVTAIGYYVYAGDVGMLGESGDGAKRVAYYIGYTMLIGGLCAVWALDIIWDDIKDD